MLGAMAIGITGDLLVPIRRPVYFDYRAQPRCAGAVEMFCCVVFAFVPERAVPCRTRHP